MSTNHLEQLSKGTASMFDANLLIFKSLLEFERQRVEEIAKRGNYAAVPCVYKDLKLWFEIQTGQDYSQENLEVKIDEHTKNHSETYCEACGEYSMIKVQDEDEDNTCEIWNCRLCDNEVTYTSTSQ